MDLSYKNKIFNLLVDNKINDFYQFIKSHPDINLDIYDENNIYVIQYLINYNQYDIIKYILENFTIRLDIIDIDGRNILYTPIKFNLNKLFDLLLEYNKKNIGMNIIDIRDKLGYTASHYSVIFNNFYTLKKLYHNNCDLYIVDNEKNNVLDLCFKYNKENFILYIVENEFNKDIYNFLNVKGESLFYQSLVFEKTKISDYLINVKNYITNIMNIQEYEYGITILHQMVITNNNKYINKLLEYGINYNIPDYYGNYAYHYAILEKNYDFLNKILEEQYNINYNNTNINGETLLHLFLLNNDKNDILQRYTDIFIKLVKNTNLNIQNNNGITSLHIIIENEYYNIIKDILSSGYKDLNLFISDNDNINGYERMNNNKEFIEIVIDSFYNKLKLISNDIDKLNIDWEKYCANGDLNKLLKVLRKKEGKTIDVYCKDNIRKIILEEKRSIPDYNNYKLNFENDIVMEKSCFYTGSTLDILFGLVYLHKNNNVDFILSYPLTQNTKLTEYYNKIGIDNSYKVEFNNIEIVWSYQKLIYMTNFDSLLLSILNKDTQFIVIPLGIEIAEGSHANIIIIDKNNKTIERFEPNGSNHPRNFYYNPILLDNLLKNKFESLLNNYKYLKPSNYLPTVGLQLLEIINDNKCKNIGDPNGYCAVWCVWYTNYRLMNPDVKPNKLINELINNIKLSNKSFKNIIRNFSKKIVILRDDILNKYNKNINDWMNNNINDDIINNIEKDIIELFN
jgi:ankyrin repeat protein